MWTQSHFGVSPRFWFFHVNLAFPGESGISQVRKGFRQKKNARGFSRYFQSRLQSPKTTRSYMDWSWLISDRPGVACACLFDLGRAGPEAPGGVRQRFHRCICVVGGEASIRYLSSAQWSLDKALANCQVDAHGDGTYFLLPAGEKLNYNLNLISSLISNLISIVQLIVRANVMNFAGIGSG